MSSCAEAHVEPRHKGLPLFLGFLFAVALAWAVAWGVLSLTVGRSTKVAAVTGTLAVMIGITQAVYIVPLYLGLRRRYNSFSTGLLRGAIIILVLDATFLAFVWSLPQLK